jgi:hypothetical protein
LWNEHSQVKDDPQLMTLSPDVTSRLAFIRYLHHLGVEQTRLPEPQSSAAVLMFHDAVEAFLLVAAEYLGTAAPRDFAQYWDVLSPAKLPRGVDLAAKQAMVRLNKVRVNLKHHGVMPGARVIDQLTEDTAVFFAANTQLVFGVDYDSVSMTDVIAQERVRELARTAESAAAAGDFLAAMVALTDAAELLLLPRRNGGAETQPLRFGETIAHLGTETFQRALQPPDRSDRSYDPHAHERGDLARHLERLSEIVTDLQAAARVTALGVDYTAYLRFQSMTPQPSDGIDGRREYRAPKGYTPTPDDYTFCLQFVITASLRLTAAHAQLQPPAWLDDDDRPSWQREWVTVATGTSPSEGYL